MNKEIKKLIKKIENFSIEQFKKENSESTFSENVNIPKFPLNGREEIKLGQPEIPTINHKKK